jgi:GNAT superfamily N-acetyltransferase
MIRPITESDIEWINKNYKEDMYTIWLANEFHKVSHEVWFWNPWYVYEWNDTIMNEYRIMWFILWESDSYRSYWEVKNLYVFDWFRSKWIWWKLVKKIEEYFKKIWLHSCELITFTEKAKQFYIKNWYEIIADYEKKYHKNDKYTRRILFAKELTK